MKAEHKVILANNALKAFFTNALVEADAIRNAVEHGYAYAKVVAIAYQFRPSVDNTMLLGDIEVLGIQGKSIKTGRGTWLAHEINTVLIQQLKITNCCGGFGQRLTRLNKACNVNLSCTQWDDAGLYPLFYQCQVPTKYIPEVERWKGIGYNLSGMIIHDKAKMSEAITNAVAQRLAIGV